MIYWIIAFQSAVEDTILLLNSSFFLFIKKREIKYMVEQLNMKLYQFNSISFFPNLILHMLPLVFKNLRKWNLFTYINAKKIIIPEQKCELFKKLVNSTQHVAIYSIAVNEHWLNIFVKWSQDSFILVGKKIVESVLGKNHYCILCS